MSALGRNDREKMDFYEHGIRFHAVKRGKGWRLRWTWPRGAKQKERLCSSKADVKRQAAEIAAPLKSDEVRLSGNDAIRVRAALAIAGAVPIDQVALEWQRENERKARLDVVERITTDRALDLFIEDKRNGNHKVSEARLNNFLKLRHFVGAFPGIQVVEIDYLAVEDYLKTWGKGKASKTIKNRRDDLATWFGWLQRKRYLPANEKHALEFVETIRYRKSEMRIWTVDEAKAILKSSPPAMIPALTIAAFASARTHEIARMSWANIRFETGFVEIPLAANRKTKRRRLVPLRDNLRAWLEPLKGKVPLSPVNKADYIGVKMTEASRAAGLEHKRNAWRATCISSLCAIGESKEKIALWSGNSVRKIEEDYEEAIYPSDGEAWFSIMPE